jgi:hypothetical protein
VAGNLLEVTGDRTVGPAGAASTKVIGVAANDAASGAPVRVWRRPGIVHRLVAQGAIAAGALVKSGTVAGSVATIGAGTFDQKVGRALEAIADTATGLVVFQP